MLALLLISMVTLAFNIQTAKASGTVIIMADGSVDPPTAPIQRDGDVYSFTDNIYDSIVVQRDNIVVDGAGFAVQGAGSGIGIDLSMRSNVTIKNMEIKAFDIGLYLWFTTNNSSITANKITNTLYGISLSCSFSTNISENDITNNWCGIDISWSYGNKFYHNNFVDNHVQVSSYGSTNTWDDGYPSGGNYWSDYTGIDVKNGPGQNLPGSDGIGDTPYIINTQNKDRYPFTKPWTPPSPPPVTAAVDIDPDTLNLMSTGQWITVYIQLPEEYNAADIDATTIRLNETISPILDPKYSFVTNPSEYLVDHSNDGILERMVKFERAAVESWIYYTQGISYGDVALTITGNLIDETFFEGTDIIFVNYPGDANHDGTIDMVDLSLVSAHWYPGPPTGPLGYDVNADFNRDGMINMLEVAIISAYWGQTVP